MATSLTLFNSQPALCSFFQFTQVFQWNLTFPQINLVYSIPHCYFEYIIVKKEINNRKHYREMRVRTMVAPDEEFFTHEKGFCGVQNHFHIFPEVMDLEIIYVTRGIESNSEFSVEFQVIDYQLIYTVLMNFGFTLNQLVHTRQTFFADQCIYSICILHSSQQTKYIRSKYIHCR